MTPIPYITPPSAVIIPRFVPLAPGLEITHHPLETDASGPGLAHLTYRGALEVAAANGARLPTRAEVERLHEVASGAGTELEPRILPDAEMRAAGAKPGDAAMVTRAWADAHDGPVLGCIAMLATSADVDQQAPIANAGKHWVGPAPAGRAALCGWWVADVSRYGSTRKGPGFIQDGTGFPHDDQHHDDATTCMLVREVAP